MTVKRKGAEIPSSSGKGGITQRVVVMVSALIRHSYYKTLRQSDVYANTIGSIWLVKDGQYSPRNSGEGYVWDIPSTSTGFYAKRVM